MKRHAIALALAASAAAPTPGAEYYWEMDAATRPAGLAEARFELWIPDTIPPSRPVRGVIGSSNYHAGAGVYDANEGAAWRAMAVRQDLAIMRYTLNSSDGLDTSEGGARAIAMALDHFAASTGRAELAHAGIVPTGLSWGAMQVCRYSRYLPARTIAALPFRATANDINSAGATAEARKVPLLHVSAGRESNNGYKPMQSQTAFPTQCAQGARFAMIVQPNDEHHTLSTSDVRYVLRWLETMIEARVPMTIVPGTAYSLIEPPEAPAFSGAFEIAQLADRQVMTNSSVTAFATVSERPADMKSYFPTRYLADAWDYYAKNTALLADTTPPVAAPTGLVVTRVTSRSIELRWDPMPGGSDPESCIFGYRVWRRVVGQQTETELAVTGRFATTFLDDGLAGNTAYSYQVAAVNGEGLVGPRCGAVIASTDVDRAPPAIVRAHARAATQVVVVFDEQVEVASAQVSANYALSGGTIVSAASLAADGVTVTLTTSALTDGQAYTLTVRNVRDRAAPPNAIPASGIQATFTFVAVLDGLTYQYYEGSWSALPNFAQLTPKTVGIASHIDVSKRERDDNFALRFSGLLDVPSSGAWTFSTVSDDGSALYIDGAQVVSNDGLHGPVERSGTVSLGAGLHGIVVTFFEAAGGESLAAYWQPAGGPKLEIPASALLRPAAGGSANLPPMASLLATPSSGAPPLTVSFDARSWDPDGSVLAHEWDWEYAGSFSADLSSGTEKTATHTYSSPGTFTAAVRVSDGAGGVVVSIATVTVGGGTTNVPPVADAGADRMILDDDLDGSVDVTLDGSGSCDSDGTVVAWVWREGGTIIATGETATVALAVGTHTIVLTVTDDRGATGTDTLVVVVRPRDDDADGLPDAWEILHFGGTDEPPEGDFDGDGATNAAEYSAGTDPTDAASVPTQSSGEVGFSCVPGARVGAASLAAAPVAMLLAALMVAARGRRAGARRASTR